MARDVAALGALRQAGRHLGEALAPLVIALAPSRVVVGGPLVAVGDHYVTGVREALAGRTPPAVSSLITVTTSDGHGRMALRGSSVLALDRLLRPAMA